MYLRRTANDIRVDTLIPMVGVVTGYQRTETPDVKTFRVSGTETEESFLSICPVSVPWYRVPGVGEGNVFHHIFPYQQRISGVQH